MAAVEKIQDLPTDISKIPPGVSTVFSPRTALKVLDTYFEMIDTAKSVACITLAFGVAKGLKAKLSDHRPEDQIIFMLLEKEDKPAPKKKSANGAAPKKPPEPFVKLTARNNVYQAYGAFLTGDALYRFTRETKTALLNLNKHVTYIHSKFLLMDPLGDDPIVSQDLKAAVDMERQDGRSLRNLTDRLDRFVEEAERNGGFARRLAPVANRWSQIVTAFQSTSFPPEAVVFSREVIREIHRRAIGLRMYDERSLLLGGIPPDVIASLPGDASPFGQLLSDLQELNNRSSAPGGKVFIKQLLENMAHQLLSRPEEAAYFQNWAEQIRLSGELWRQEGALEDSQTADQPDQ